MRQSPPLAFICMRALPSRLGGIWRYGFQRHEEPVREHGAHQLPRKQGLLSTTLRFIPLSLLHIKLSALPLPTP